MKMPDIIVKSTQKITQAFAKDPKKAAKTLAVIVGVSLVLLILVLCIVKAADSGNTESSSLPPAEPVNPFVGMWHYNTGTAFFNIDLFFDFKENGTVKADVGYFNANGKYSWEGDEKSGKLTLDIPEAGDYGKGTYDYTVTGDGIVLSDGANSITLRHVERSENEESK